MSTLCIWKSDKVYHLIGKTTDLHCSLRVCRTLC